MFLQLTLKKDKSSFYLLVWWLLSTGIFLFTYIPAANQIVLKFIIPVLFLAVIIKEKIIGIDKGLKMYIWLLLWASLSLFYTVDSTMTLRYLQGMIGNVIIWYIAARCIKKIDGIKKLSYPLMFSFLIQLYFTLIAPVQASLEEINARLDRVSGLSANENDQGRLLFFGIIISLLLVLYTKNKVLKIIYWLSIVLFFIAIFRTGSRSSLIACLLFFVVFIFLNARKKNYGILIISLAIGFLLYQYGYDYFLSNTSMGHRLELAVNKRGDEPRIILLKEGLNFFLQNPIMGVGLGSYVYYSSTHHYSHNDFIEVLASMGLPAFFIYMSIFWNYWKRTGKLFKYTIGYYKKLIIIAFSFLIGYLALGIWDPSVYFPTTILMFAFFYSLVNKIYNQFHFDLRSKDLYNKKHYSRHTRKNNIY